MRTVAVIPARGGSKGIPLKNMQKVNGRTLVERAVHFALQSNCFSQVYVSTDDASIAEEAERCGASALARPDDLARDESSSESVLVHHLMREVAERSDYVAFMQCTSPFVSVESLRAGAQEIRAGSYQSLFSARPDHTFQWHLTASGECLPKGHEKSSRARRQDLSPIITESGAFYFMDTTAFLDQQTRFCGRVGSIIVSKVEALEIDTVEDLALANRLASDWDQVNYNRGN